MITGVLGLVLLAVAALFVLSLIFELTGLAISLLFGAACGYIACRIMGTDEKGFIKNLILGVVGGLIGGLIGSILKIGGGFIVSSLLRIGGACLVIFGCRKIGKI